MCLNLDTGFYYLELLPSCKLSCTLLSYPLHQCSILVYDAWLWDVRSLDYNKTIGVTFFYYLQQKQSESVPRAFLCLSIFFFVSRYFLTRSVCNLYCGEMCEVITLTWKYSEWPALRQLIRTSVGVKDSATRSTGSESEFAYLKNNVFYDYFFVRTTHFGCYTHTS